MRDWTERSIDVGPVRLHCVCAGDRGPLVVLLHGFPEYWGAWRGQLEELPKRGLRVVAPDLRGYNLSDKPSHVSDYRVERLAEDIGALVRACLRDDEEDAIVVGHDWGAMVAWQVAMTQPDVVRKLGILNVPHPIRMMQGLRSPTQLKKSWYMAFFQLPVVPEWAMRVRDFASVRRGLAADGVSACEIEGFVEAARKSGLRYGINYYRAAARALFSPAPVTRIDVPVLVLWGERDRFLGKELATPPPEYVPNARVVFFPHASHWVQQDAGPEVNSHLAEFALS